MLRKASDLMGLKLGARDGEIGRVKDVYFDDHTWTVRYLVADTGTWLTGRRVLISPFAIESVDMDHRHINVKLTREQVERSPSVDEHKPVSRQFEADYARYYGWPMYWYGPALWGPTPFPLYDGVEREPARDSSTVAQETGDPHLRSASEVKGYYLHARDGDLGHIEDFVIADADWAIRYLIADTNNWRPGGKALIATPWITSVSWDKSHVAVDLTHAQLQSGPEYRRDTELSRDLETRLHNHYRRPPYWERTHEQAA
jgi:hypothetical protein